MAKLQVTPKMQDGLTKITSSYAKVNNLTTKEWDQLTDKMAKSHPLIISIFMGFHASKDFNPAQLGTIMKILASIWLYNGGERAKKVNEKAYKASVKKNAEFAKYLEGEFQKDKSRTLEDHLVQNTSSVILTYLFFSIRETPEFKGLTEAEQGVLVMELKSLQDCFHQ